MKIKAMIVDDEPFAREDLRFMVAQHSEIEVKWEAARVDEARSLLATHCPDVIFLDIELRDGSGIKLASTIDQEKTKVIFVTGRNDNLERARKTSALDCLLKPVGIETLSACLEKLRHDLETRKGDR